jgi:hypothetical protein
VCDKYHLKEQRLAGQTPEDANYYGSIPQEELEEVDRDIQKAEPASEMAARRDQITNVMWEDYCLYNRK